MCVCKCPFVWDRYRNLRWQCHLHSQCINLLYMCVGGLMYTISLLWSLGAHTHHYTVCKIFYMCTECPWCTMEIYLFSWLSSREKRVQRPLTRFILWTLCAYLCAQTSLLVPNVHTHMHTLTCIKWNTSLKMCEWVREREKYKIEWIILNTLKENFEDIFVSNFLHNNWWALI